MDRFEEIFEHNNSRKLNILKGFVEIENIIEKAKNRQVGEVHSSGKYVWTALPNGKFDWRVAKTKNSEPSEEDSELKIPLRDINKIKQLSEYINDNYESIGQYYDYNEYYYATNKPVSSKQFKKQKEEFDKKNSELDAITSKYSSDQLINQINDKHFQGLNTAGDYGY